MSNAVERLAALQVGEVAGTTHDLGVQRHTVTGVLDFEEQSQPYTIFGARRFRKLRVWVEFAEGCKVDLRVEILLLVGSTWAPDPESDEWLTAHLEGEWYAIPTQDQPSDGFSIRMSGQGKVGVTALHLETIS